MPGENDAVHAQVYLGSAGQTIQQLTDALSQTGPDTDPRTLQEPLAYIEAILRHTGPHLANLAQDETRKELFGQLRKAFQQIQAQWASISSVAQKLTPSQQDQQGFATKMQMKMQEHQVNLQNAVEDATVKRDLRVQDVQQKMQLRRITTGVKISTHADEQAAKAASR